MSLQRLHEARRCKQKRRLWLPVRYLPWGEADPRAGSPAPFTSTNQIAWQFCTTPSSWDCSFLPEGARQEQGGLLHTSAL